MLLGSSVSAKKEQGTEPQKKTILDSKYYSFAIPSTRSLAAAAAAVAEKRAKCETSVRLGARNTTRAKQRTKCPQNMTATNAALREWAQEGMVEPPTVTNKSATTSKRCRKKTAPNAHQTGERRSITRHSGMLCVTHAKIVGNPSHAPLARPF